MFYSLQSALPCISFPRFNNILMTSITCNRYFKNMTYAYIRIGTGIGYSAQRVDLTLTKRHFFRAIYLWIRLCLRFFLNTSNLFA